MLSMQEGAHWDIVVPPQLAYQGTKHGASARAAAMSLLLACCSSVPLHCRVCILRQSPQPAITALLFLRGVSSSLISNLFK